MLRAWIDEQYEGCGLVVLDGHDNAIIGVVDIPCFGQAVCYDRSIILENLEEQGMEYTEAVEYYDFNIAGLSIEGGPVYITTPEWYKL